MPATSAYDVLRSLFASFGLPDAPDILDAIKAGALAGEDESSLTVRLQQTQSWKERFAGNEIRRQKGMNVLDVRTYLAQEEQMRQVLRNAGLPAGFYDQQGDFTNFIGNDVSVQELQDRVNLAGDIVTREDPAVAAQLAARGMDNGMLLAYTLDPTRAKPLVQRLQNSILVGAAGARSGLSVTTGQADRLSEQGIGEAQAIQGFGQINDFLSDADKLGDVYGVDYTTDDAIGEVFEGDSGDKRKRLARTERSAFSGQATYGVARRDSSGAY